MHNQMKKKVSGEWLVQDELDSMVIKWSGGFIEVTNKLNYTLLACTPNQTKSQIPIFKYKVSITIEALEDEAL